MARHRNRNKRGRKGNGEEHGSAHGKFDHDGDVQIQDNAFGKQGIQDRGLASKQQDLHPHRPNSRRQKRSRNDKRTLEPYVSPVFDRKSDSPDLDDRVSNTTNYDHGQRRQRKKDTRQKNGNYQWPIPPPSPQPAPFPLPLPCFPNIPNVPILDPGFFDDCKQAIDELYSASLRVLSLYAQYSGVAWKNDGFGAEEMEWEPCAATQVVYINQLIAMDNICSDSGYQSESFSDGEAQEGSPQPGCLPSEPVFPQEAGQDEGYAAQGTIQYQEYAEPPRAEQNASAPVEHQNHLSQAASKTSVKESWASTEDWRNSSRDAGSYRRFLED